MSGDEIARDIAAKLAEHHPQNTLTNFSEDDLIAALKSAVATRRNLEVVIGRVAAELYRRNSPYRGRPLGTWRGLADAVDMNHTTLMRWATPYLASGPRPPADT
jgi:hypothetical protein